MAPVMKAVKAMKARKAGGAMTATGAFSSVVENTGTKSKDVKVVMGGNSKSGPRKHVNESYLTFIISQAIGCRHNLEFH